MTKDEALDLALEALDNLLYWDNGKSDYDQAREAITAIKQARALDKKAENARELGLDYEPVGQYSDIVSDGGFDPRNKFYTTPPAAPVQEDWGPGPHECHSLTAAPVQEPVAYCDPSDPFSSTAFSWPGTEHNSSHTQRLYTTPPAAQRQWVDLNDDERVDLYKSTETDHRMVLIDAVLTKAKEKNNG